MITTKQSTVFPLEYGEVKLRNEIPQRAKCARFGQKQGADGGLLIDNLCLEFTANDPNAFLLNVENGTGGDYFKENKLVSVTANDAPDGYRFVNWTGNVQYMANTESPATRMRMPAQNIMLAANYELVVGLDDLTGDNKIATVYPNPAKKIHPDRWPEKQSKETS